MSAHTYSRRRGRVMGHTLTGLTTVAAAAAAATSAVSAGCAPQPVAVAPIKIASAYIMQSSGSNGVAAYFVIANAGPADRLLSVRSSAGGQVLMIGPAARGPAATSAIASLAVVGHGLTRLNPSGYHLEILHSGRLRQGTDVTLTLVFAHAGTMRVPAQVNNPANNNGGYFGP